MCIRDMPHPNHGPCPLSLMRTAEEPRMVVSSFPQDPFGSVEKHSVDEILSH